MTRKILLSCTGGSPQIVTETIYALAVQGIPQDATGEIKPWIPNEVHIITTTEGANNVRFTLLDGPDGQGIFNQLRNYYDLPEINFSEKNIHILTDPYGKELADIRTEEHNICAANQITEWLRQYTNDAETELHVSIAGGRKTMGFFLGSALSLLGRKQDRLSHVLVNTPFENNRNFFYPTKNSSYRVHIEGTTYADAKDAEVDLSFIPFVPLREILPSNVIEKSTTFSKVVEAASKFVDLATREHSLILYPSQHKTVIHGEEVKLTRTEFIILLWFANRKKQHRTIDWNDRKKDKLGLTEFDKTADDFCLEFPTWLYKNYPNSLTSAEVRNYKLMRPQGQGKRPSVQNSPKLPPLINSKEEMHKYFSEHQSRIRNTVKGKLEKLMNDYFPTRSVIKKKSRENTMNDDVQNKKTEDFFIAIDADKIEIDSSVS
jgi:CRISPR-associated protein (TIGR02584 family)